jgi:hypothetical protein
MNKQRKTSHILNVFQYDADGHVVLPASLTLGIVPGAEDNSGKVPSTAWVRSLVSATGSSLVPTNRSITINGTSYDLSSNRSWSIDTGVLTASAGSGISVSVVNQNLNIVNTGLLTGTAGAGISVSTVNQNLNIVNTGLLSATAGSGISVSTVNQNLNIVNTGILTASAGSGVSVSVVGQNLNIVNSGILTATAGAGISLSVVSGNLNIVNTITDNNQLANGAGYATTSYVTTQINNLVAGAPGLLDTLDELAAALGDDANFATTITTSISTKQAQLNGTGFVKVTGTTVSYDNSTYLTTSSAASTYASLTGSYANPSWITSLAWSKITGAPAFITSSALSSYLPLSGGTLTGELNFSTSGAATTNVAKIFFGTMPNPAGSLTSTQVSGYGVDGYGLILQAGYSGDMGGLKITDDGVVIFGAADEGLFHLVDEDGNATWLSVDNSGNLTSNGYSVWNAGNLTNLNQLSNGPGYITSSALSGYATQSWVTSQGYITGYSETDTLATVTNRGNTASTAINTTVGANAWAFNGNTSGYSNASGIWFTNNVGELLLRNAAGSLITRIAADGSYAFINSSQIILASNISSYAVTSLTDTLATVTARGGSTTAGITVNGRVTASGGGTYAVTGSSTQRYIIQALNTSNSVNSSYGWWWFHNANGDMGFHADAVGDILTLTRAGGATINGNTILTAGNYTSYTYSTSDADSRFLRGTTNPGSVNNFTISIGNNGSYSYVQSHSGQPLHLNPVGNSVFIGSGSTVLHSSNYNSYSPTLTGGGASGTWGISITGNAATLGGYSPNQTGGAYNIVQRDVNGYIQNNYFYMSGGGSERNSSGLGYVAGFNSSDYYVRSYNSTAVASFLGLGSMAYASTGSYLALSGGTMTGTITITSSDIRSNASSGWTGDPGSQGKIQYHSNRWYIVADQDSNRIVQFRRNGTDVSYIDNNGVYQGSISGNADTVDGYHATNAASGLARYESNGYLYIPSWLNVNGGGIFSSTNNAHIRPNSGSYGAWEMIGSKNGWSGIWFNDSGDYLMANSNEAGHYQNGVGWKFRWYQGTMYVSRGTNGGGTEYTVVDTGNISSYTSGNTNSISAAVGGSYTWTSTNYFRSNLGGYSGSLSNPPLQAYSDSNNSAFMSFHKGGHYAVNFGLDADNILRIGGWSASANRWELDMSGNNSIPGYIRANGGFGTNGAGSGGNTTSGRVYGPAGGAYSFSGGGITGAIKIRLPFRNNDLMWSMKVRIYNYSTNETSEYLLGNYAYSQGGWNSSASFIGGSSAVPRTVRFGNEGGYDCVWIGETSTSWSYPVISIMDFAGGYSNGGVNNYLGNWDITITQSIGTVGTTITPAIRFSDVTTASITATSINAPSGYVSNGNPWGTSNSAFFPNGITTAGGTNWIYGQTYIGNAPSNGDGHNFSTSGVGESTREYNIGKNSGNNWGLGVYYGNDGSGYGRIRFYQGGSNHSTIHSFCANWQSGSLAGHSTGALNIEGQTGVTFGAWNIVDAYITRGGSAWFRYDVTAYSDSRVKTNVKVVDNAIEKIQAIRGVTFNRTDKTDTDKRYAGVIAQEVLPILPEVVTQDTEGMYSVSYGNMAALFIEAIKEQQKQIEELQNKLDNVLSSR